MEDGNIERNNADHKTSTKRVNCAVVIPALNPTKGLVTLVRGLLECGISKVIVVNDGSDGSFEKVFSEVAKLKNAAVLSHETNRGKGRALKTAFTYVNEHYPYIDGVVTADADGQHSVEDIYKICEKLSLTKDALILGVRDFSKMPKRSYRGNIIASRIFQLLYSSKLEDTQTGLRGIPINALEWMVRIKGERYDYETNMLIKSKGHNLSFITVSIKTLYFDNNSGTHYSAVNDSILIFVKLMSGLIKYSGLTIISGIIDVFAFFMLNSVVLAKMPASLRIFIGTIAARIVSSVCNYIMNKVVMFKNNSKSTGSAVRYYVLFSFLIISSYVLVYTVSLFWRVNESIIKLIVDIALGFISYQVQLRWVFPNKEYSTHISV